MFPGDDPSCDAGGRQKVVLTERQAIAMPASMIHMVETHSESVALDVNLIHRRLPAVFDTSRKTKSPSAAATLLFRCWL